jgi:hypothetical protein
MWPGACQWARASASWPTTLDRPTTAQARARGPGRGTGTGALSAGDSGWQCPAGRSPGGQTDARPEGPNPPGRTRGGQGRHGHSQLTVLLLTSRADGLINGPRAGAGRLGPCHTPAPSRCLELQVASLRLKLNTVSRPVNRMGSTNQSFWLLVGVQATFQAA